MDNDFGKNKNTKRILITSFLVMLLVVSVTGATYAYFAIGAISNNTITGTAATASLYWGGNNTTGIPNLVAPNGSYTTTPLVPQKSLNGSTNVLQKAVTGVTPNGGSSVVPCVDANGNAICRVYTFTICNNSSAATRVNGTIKFHFPNGTTFNNLKWLLMTNSTTTGTVSASTIKSASTTAQTFESSQYLGADTDPSLTACGTTSSGSNANWKTYSIVTWIEEINEDQGGNAATTKMDQGTYYATIEFKDSTGNGITSTITS
ncbi:MAG: hypothetical protein VZS44_03780 [Bacilli bacterium]|nr:hypothetical protein [Bacilli bacterium]